MPRLELLGKSGVWLNKRAAVFQEAEGGVDVIAMGPDEVHEGEGGGAGDAHGAVDEHRLGAQEGAVEGREHLGEVREDVVARRIVHRHVLVRELARESGRQLCSCAHDVSHSEIVQHFQFVGGFQTSLISFFNN